MRTTTTTTTGQTLSIGYPNSVAFMYSPQLVRITGNTKSDATVTATVTHLLSGRTYTETRSFHDGAVEFDISRVMQLLSPDVDTLFQRLNYAEGQSLAEPFALALSYKRGGTSSLILNVQDIVALYGALDQGETYGGDIQRRLWLNLPQTFNLWEDDSTEVLFSFDDADVYPDIIAGGEDCYECSLMQALLANGEDAILEQLYSGQSPRLFITARAYIANGYETGRQTRRLTLKPDAGQPTDGTYLRWLNRRGEVSYWLFKNSQVRVTTAANNGFERHYEGDPSAPVAGCYVNRHKEDFREAREMVIGAVGLSLAEYEDLCSLATSPLVERLMLGAWDSEGSPAYTWQRVNVAAGTYSRNIKRQTPNLQDLEFVIELPERNTIKL